MGHDLDHDGAGDSTPALLSPDELEALYRGSRHDFYAFATSLIKQFLIPSADTTPDDLVQFAFARMLQRWQIFGEPSRYKRIPSPKPYLFKVMRNLAKDRIRHLKAKAALTDAFAAAAKTATNTPDRDIIEVDAAIKVLPPRLKKAMEAFIRNDCNYRAAANELFNGTGPAPSAVYQRVRRDVHKSLNAMAEYLHPPESFETDDSKTDEE